MKRPKLWQYLISFFVGAAIAFGVFFAKDLFERTDLSEIYKILSDGFFVAGVLLGGLGLLVFGSNGGTFDMLVYGVSSVIALVFPGARRHDTFFDYRMARNRRRSSFVFLLLVGLFYLALAIVFSMLYTKLQS